MKAEASTRTTPYLSFYRIVAEEEIAYTKHLRECVENGTYCFEYHYRHRKRSAEGRNLRFN
jgi:hypothetical protein